MSGRAGARRPYGTDDPSSAPAALHTRFESDALSQQLVDVYPRVWNREGHGSTGTEGCGVLFGSLNPGLQTLDPLAWPSFPGGGVPQKLKANPSNASTVVVLNEFHSSRFCAFKSIRLQKRGYTVVRVVLSQRQSDAVAHYSDAILAGCLPVVVTAEPAACGVALIRSQLEGFIITVDSSSQIRMVHASYSDASCYVSRGHSVTRGVLLAKVQESGVALSPGSIYCVLNTALVPTGPCRLLFNIPALFATATEGPAGSSITLCMEQALTLPRVVCNDLVAAKRVRMAAPDAALGSRSCSAVQLSQSSSASASAATGTFSSAVGTGTAAGPSGHAWRSAPDKSNRHPCPTAANPWSYYDEYFRDTGKLQRPASLLGCTSVQAAMPADSSSEHGGLMERTC